MFIFKAKNQRSFSDYHEKKLENPFFKKKEGIVDWSGWKLKILLILAAIIFIATAWFFCFSSFWKIREVSVNGLDRMSSEEIQQMLNTELDGRKFLFLPKDNLLFFDEEKFAAAIKDKYRFQGVAVHKKIPGKVVIDIREKPLACVWNEGDKYYYVDIEGYVVSEVNPIDLADRKYPLIANASPLRLAAGKIQVGLDCLAAAAALFKKTAEKALGINIEKFIVDQEMETIKIQTPEGLLISFDSIGDLDKQLEKLAALKNQKLKDDFFKKKSIDLRFGDKIYYQ